MPDVKEFECMSIEGSADGSFDVPDFAQDAEEWEDEHDEDGNDDSLEGILDVGRMDRAMGGLTIMDDSQIFVGDEEADTVDEHDQSGNGESTTANFLMEQGIFTPEADLAPTMLPQDVPDVPPIPAQHARPDLQARLQQLAVPASNAQQHPTSPSLGTASTASSHAPCLSTPSFGGSINLDPTPVFPEHDEAGIPYGRSHHAERNALAHAHPVLVKGHLQPAQLPKNGEHQMLLNGNVTQPALPASPVTAAAQARLDEGPRAHQEGQFHDPFITIQTATAVLSPYSQSKSKDQERTEDGVPLGRTSHIERMHAARQLASQGIGLGLPRSPARMDEPLMDVRAYPQPPNAAQIKEKAKLAREEEDVQDVQSESGTEIDSGDEGDRDEDERFFAEPSRGGSKADGVQGEKGYHPPRAVDVPSPVVVDAPKEVQMRVSYYLPPSRPGGAYC